MFELSQSEAHKYSVAKGILAAATGDSSFEIECSQDIAKALGRPPRSNGGFFCPTRLRPQAAGLDTRTNVAGAYTLGMQVELVEALRTQIRCVQLGAQFLGGLRVGGVRFATESATTSASWVAENPGVDVSDFDASFIARTAVAHSLQGSTSFSKQLLAQNNVDIENFVRRSLMRSHAIAVDGAAIAGNGTLGAPVGLLHQADLPVVSIGTDGAAASYANLCSLEETIALANADSSAIAFLTTPTQRRKLRLVSKNGTGSEMAWDDEGPGPLGLRGAVSNAVPSNLAKGSGVNLSAIIAGDFALGMLITEFGFLELITDQFRLKRQGLIEVTSFEMIDVVFRHIPAFAVILDAA